MNHENEISDWQSVSTELLQESRPPAQDALSRVGPYETSLLGEYARLFLLLLAMPLAIWFAQSVANQETGMLGLISTGVLLGSLVTPRGSQILRIIVMVAMTLNVAALVINPNDIVGSSAGPATGFGTYLLLVCLATASFFELQAWVQSSTRETIVKTIAWSLLAIPAVAYIVIVPLFYSIWEHLFADEKTLALKDPNWSLSNEAAFRASKFSVFAIFAYFGACLGSFLNVVAASVPRGESIVLRDSSCPKCNTKIRRLDNLPIFSYVNLGARCRSCDASIPPRYLIVELVLATVFGSLFLYQLVTGCDNVPLMNVNHEGILWIILYPKWPAIGIYFFHCFFMSIVLVLALMEWDKQPLKLVFGACIGLVFFVSAAVYLPIQPIPLLEHVPGLSLGLPVWADQLIKLVVGAIVGAVVGRLVGKLFVPENPSLVTFAFSLTGLVLGWQALIQVTLFFAFAMAMVRIWPKAKQMFEGHPTAVLLIAIVFHHPFWKLIADSWRFS